MSSTQKIFYRNGKKLVYNRASDLTTCWNNYPDAALKITELRRDARINNEDIWIDLTSHNENYFVVVYNRIK